MPDRSVITVSFPAEPEFLRLARLATADVGSRAGFDYEEIDDLRIGVSELCSMISGADASTITLEFAIEDTSVTVVGVAESAALVENDLSQTIVRAVVDDYDIAVHDGIARFQASKRARSAG